MKKIFILMLLLTYTAIQCHINPVQTSTIFYLERENDTLEIPVHVTCSVEPFDANKDRSDYIDLGEIPNPFLKDDSKIFN